MFIDCSRTDATALRQECERGVLLLAINMALLTECERCLRLRAINMALLTECEHRLLLRAYKHGTPHGVPSSSFANRRTGRRIPP